MCFRPRFGVGDRGLKNGRQGNDRGSLGSLNRSACPTSSVRSVAVWCLDPPSSGVAGSNARASGASFGPASPGAISLSVAPCSESSLPLDEPFLSLSVPGRVESGPGRVSGWPADGSRFGSGERSGRPFRSMGSFGSMSGPPGSMPGSSVPGLSSSSLGAASATMSVVAGAAPGSTDACSSWTDWTKSPYAISSANLTRVIAAPPGVVTDGCALPMEPRFVSDAGPGTKYATTAISAARPLRRPPTALTGNEKCGDDVFSCPRDAGGCVDLRLVRREATWTALLDRSRQVLSPQRLGRSRSGCKDLVPGPLLLNLLPLCQAVVPAQLRLALASLLVARHGEDRRNLGRAAVVVQGDHREVRGGGVEDLAGAHVLGLHAHSHLHRAAPRGVHRGLHRQELTNDHRVAEVHAVDRRGHDAGAGVAHRRDPRHLVAEVHDHPAVHVAGIVGVGDAHPAAED